MAWQGRGMVGVWHGMVGHGRVWVGQKIYDLMLNCMLFLY